MIEELGIAIIENNEKEEVYFNTKDELKSNDFLQKKIGSKYYLVNHPKNTSEHSENCPFNTIKDKLVQIDKNNEIIYSANILEDVKTFQKTINQDKQDVNKKNRIRGYTFIDFCRNVITEAIPFSFNDINKNNLNQLIEEYKIKEKYEEIEKSENKEKIYNEIFIVSKKMRAILKNYTRDNLYNKINFKSKQIKFNQKANIIDILKQNHKKLLYGYIEEDIFKNYLNDIENDDDKEISFRCKNQFNKEVE